MSGETFEAVGGAKQTSAFLHAYLDSDDETLGVEVAAMTERDGRPCTAAWGHVVTFTNGGVKLAVLPEHRAAFMTAIRSCMLAAHAFGWDDHAALLRELIRHVAEVYAEAERLDAQTRGPVGRA